MDSNKKEKIIYDIILGIKYFYLDGKEYRFVPNNKFDIYHSNYLYNQFIHEHKYDGLMTVEDQTKYLNHLGLWTFKNTEDLKSLEKNLENMKLDLFLNRINVSYANKLRKKISSVKTGILRSHINKNKFLDETLEHHASEMRDKFLICMSIRNHRGKKICNKNNFLDIDNRFIQIHNDISNKEVVTVAEFREIARTQPFRGMWNYGKYRVFDRKICELTKYQKVLASYSVMYDNVFKSVECPTDDVINDDDMLDGWFIQQRKEQEERRKEKERDKIFSKFKDKDGQELFVVSSDKEEVSQIYNMNDHSSRNIIKSRNQQIERDKIVKHGNLKDVKMDLHMQATQEMRQNMRNRR